MISQELQKFNLPRDPGVYLFKNKGEILYIGKATSLKDRVRSYFANDLLATRSPLIADMVFKAKTIEFIKTDSVLEALILEAELIKKHQPKYNTKEKDDKSYNYVIVTKEDFPRVLIERGKNLKGDVSFKIKNSFGPFTNASQLRDALKIIRKIFPFRDTCKLGQDRPCFNYGIGLCPGTCIGAISKKEYGKIIKNIQLFFEGKKKSVIKNLQKDIKEFVKKQAFEKAGEIQKKIFALNHIQDIALIKNETVVSDFRLEGVFRIEAYDVAHISGTNTVGVMTVVEDGRVNKNEYRKFNINKSIQNDVAGLREILERRLNHTEWQMPDIVVVDGGIQQKNVAEKVMGEYGKSIVVIAVTKDERHRPKTIQGREDLIKKYKNEILLSNSEAHRFAIGFHISKRQKGFLS